MSQAKKVFKVLKWWWSCQKTKRETSVFANCCSALGIFAKFYKANFKRFETLIKKLTCINFLSTIRPLWYRWFAWYLIDSYSREPSVWNFSKSACTCTYSIFEGCLDWTSALQNAFSHIQAAINKFYWWSKSILWSRIVSYHSGCLFTVHRVFSVLWHWIEFDSLSPLTLAGF